MPSRRKVLKYSTAFGMVPIAGCMGGGGQDDDNGADITIAHAGASTSGGTTTEALRRAVSEHSNEVSVSTTESGGDPASIRLYNQGNAEGYPSSNFISLRAAADEEPFNEEPVEEVAHQGWRFGTIQCFWMAESSTGIESIEDLAGRDVWPLDPAWGIRQFNEVVLQEHGIWDEINVMNIDSGDLAGAVEEGRIEAFVGFGTNSTQLTGWMTETAARSNVHMLEVTDDFVEAIQSVTSAVYEEIEPYGFDQDVGLDQIVTWGLPYQLWFGSNVADDAVYELARVTYEHHDTIRESDSAFPDMSDISNMTSTYIQDIPVHSGVEQFLKDQDAWDNSWPTN